jgi:acyl dehydratase
VAQTIFETLDEVRAAVGRHLGTTDWITLSQDQVDRFTRATGDEEGDGGGHGDVPTAAPPLLVLSLTNLFLPQIVEVRGASMGVNYGTGAVRFPAPAPVGSRIRGRADLVGCEDIRGGVQTTMRITVDVDGRDEPACVVDALSRWLQ